MAASKQLGDGIRRDGRVVLGASHQDDICPVCKSSRYMNSNLRFLINPECYHKMCESCVDRTFSHGQAPCPIPGCGRILRKGRFRQQTFEDLRVEREVDIRKNVSAVFNRREDDFESLRDYNDYLNEVEDITFNLINSIDLEDTQARFDRYKRAHEQDIATNASLAQQESISYTALQKAERAQARQRREAAQREEAEERREAQENKRDILRRLEAGQDAQSVTSEGQKLAAGKRQIRVSTQGRNPPLQKPSEVRNGSSDLLIKGLKAKVKPQVQGPVDPFGGINLNYPLYYRLQDDYVWDAYKSTKKEPAVSAGGYDVVDFTQRALREAFGGLGVFVPDEVVTSSHSMGHTTTAQEAQVLLNDVEMSG